MRYAGYRRPRPPTFRPVAGRRAVLAVVAGQPAAVKTQLLSQRPIAGREHLRRRGAWRARVHPVRTVTRAARLADRQRDVLNR